MLIENDSKREREKIAMGKLSACPSLNSFFNAKSFGGQQLQ
jgi:hypothetical protein